MSHKFSAIYLPQRYFDKVCRICLSDAKVLVPIKQINFTHCLNMKGSVENISLRMVLYTFCNIEVMESDHKPQQICETCINMGCKAFNFFQLFVCSNELLESKLPEELRSKKSMPELETIDSKNQSNDHEALTNTNLPSDSAQAKGQNESDFESINVLNTVAKTQQNSSPVRNGLLPAPSDINTSAGNSLEGMVDHDYCSESQKKAKKSLFEILREIKVILNLPKGMTEEKIPKSHLKETENGREIFTCTFCKLTFYGIEKVFDHVRNKHPNDKLCILCRKKYNLTTRYMYHIATHSSKTALCRVCSIHFKTHEELIEHNRCIDHENAKCRLCNKKFSHERRKLWYSLRLHVERVHLKKTKYQCQICGKIFLYYANLRRHIHASHLNDRKFLCQHCAKCFTNNHNLKIHMQRDHGNELGLVLNRKGESLDAPLIECEYCPLKFKRIYYFYRHSQEHLEFAEYKCEICKLVYKTYKDLREHQNEHEQFQCPHCDEKFVSKVILYQHKDRHKNSMRYKRKDIKCQYCPKIFRNTYRFYIHCRNQHSEFKNYRCEVCKLVFEDMKSLREHQTEHKKFQCTLCERKFVSRNALSTHRSMHKLAKRCPVCHIVVSGGNVTLKIHMNIHTGSRPFVCEKCGKGFRQPSHLACHMFQHGGEKPWKCEHCEKALHFESTLKNHIRSHTGEKPYNCLYCRRAFRDTTIRHKHIKKDHPEKYKDYELSRKSYLKAEKDQIERRRNCYGNKSDNSSSDN